MSTQKDKNEDDVFFDVNRGLERLNSKIDEHEYRSLARRRQKNLVLGIAATFVVFAVAFLSLFYQNKDMVKPITLIEKINPLGQKSTFKLSDGSLVKLNSGSKLVFAEEFNANERKVILKGEAFFDVKKDPERPFRVTTEGLTTTVLGTSFNVKSFEEEKKAVVSVASGRVMVENDLGDKVTLVPSEEAIYDRETKQLQKGSAQMEKTLAWRDNILWFENSSMQEVAKGLDKWYGISTSFKTEEISACRITGKFKNESLSNVLKSIQLSTGINYEKRESHVAFLGKGCK